MRKYKHLFFDLDHTLWDFDTNAHETLAELYDKYDLGRFFESFAHFFDLYQPGNLELWEQYRAGKINKTFLNTERFYRPLKMAGFDDLPVAQLFADDFITQGPLKTNLLPHTIGVLNYLKPHYQMHIITNGFRETQILKLERSGLRPYFKHIFISENIGANKPKKAFFEHAVKSANARKRESLVIGDSWEADIVGARNFGLDQVYFNPSRAPHEGSANYEIVSLDELFGIL